MFCECISQAGIKGNQLTIALEPEAASIYCQELRTDRENKTNITFSETIKKGMKYVVVDLGGNSNLILYIMKRSLCIYKKKWPDCFGVS